MARTPEDTEVLRSRFTEEGLRGLTNKLRSYITLFREQKEYPIRTRIIGFGAMTITDRADLASRIFELAEDLGANLEVGPEGENDVRIALLEDEPLAGTP